MVVEHLGLLSWTFSIVLDFLHKSHSTFSTGSVSFFRWKGYKEFCWLLSPLDKVTLNEPVYFDFYTEVREKRNLGLNQYFCAFCVDQNVFLTHMVLNHYYDVNPLILNIPRGVL